MPPPSSQGARKRIPSKLPQQTSSLPQTRPKKDDKTAKYENTEPRNPERQVTEGRLRDSCDVKVTTSSNGAIMTSLLVTLVTAVGRVYYITLETSRWVLHPDEIYQGVEVAYSEIYGYGFRPYEFLPPMKGGNLTQYQQWEQMHGMYALRSPLFPWFYVAVSCLVDGFGGCAAAPYLIWRTSHVVLASLVPLAAHGLTLALSGSHDAGVAAAMLAAGSVHLTVLGTHTLLHSVLAPPLVLALAGLHVALIQGPQDADVVPLVRDQGGVNVSHPTEQGSSCADLTGAKRSKADASSRSVQAECEKLCGAVTDTKRNKIGASSPSAQGERENLHGNIAGESSCRRKSKGEDSLAAASVGEAGLVSSGMFSSGCVMACGFCVAVSCYIRPDSSLFVCVFFFPFLSPSQLSRLVKQKRYFIHTLLCITGVIMGVGVGICADFHFYGVGVISPVNWFKFNVLSNATAVFFGSEPLTFYCGEIFFRNSGMVFLFVLNVAGTITSLWQVFKLGHKKDGVVLNMRLMVCIVVLLGFYSTQAHKELRFIHHVIVLYFVFTAINVSSVVATLSRVGVRIPPRLTGLSIVVLFSCSQWQGFPTATHKSLKSWVYGDNTETYDVTRCVNYVSSQKDVRGMFLNVNINMMGGFTFLRHNVPLLVLTSTGYHEYGMSVRHTAKQKLHPFKTSNVISLATAVKLSNYFDPQNKPYLLHHLISHREYNYLLMASSVEFLSAGYKVVFDTGRCKVVKRLGTEEDEKRLQEMVPLLRSEPDGSVLKREASQLHAFGLKDMAARRFERGKVLEGK
ncbi:hypothetical protein ACOMHN_018902 [Nucella lapillus]